ncbi:MAG: glutamyl-tRNA reductase [Thermomicrobiales bacterium]
MTVLLLGANHDTAAVAVRECLAIPEERIADTLRFLAPSTGELIAISTCNRTEFYAASTESERALRQFIYRHSDLDEGTLDHALYRLEGRDAVRHLLRVSCGLDSMIVGEPQILGQVRDALQLAQQAGSAGPVITALFQAALNAGKTARAVTGISRGALSVSQSAVDLAAHRLGSFEDRTAVVIGAGETGAIVAHNLRARGIGQLIIANRTLERARHLADDLHGEAITLDELPGAIARADLVVAATGAPDEIVRVETVTAGGAVSASNPRLMIDIAVPRDIALASPTYRASASATLTTFRNSFREISAIGETQPAKSSPISRNARTRSSAGSPDTVPGGRSGIFTTMPNGSASTR